jgi:hypothetical protein
MSRKWLIVIGLLSATVVSGLTCWHVVGQTAVPLIRYGASGPNAVFVSPEGWITLLGTIASTLGLGGGSLWALVHNVWHAIPIFESWKSRGDTAIDLGQLIVYVELYKSETDAAAKAKIRESARIASDNLFNGWFPASASEVIKSAAATLKPGY